MTQYIGIEGGGTKFVCAYGSSPDDLHDRTVIHTRHAAETMRDVLAYVHAVKNKVRIAAIGASVFGPLDLDVTSPTYGYITTCVKPGWENCDFIGLINSEFNVPIGFDTDVNAAAMGEARWGAAKGLSDFLYLTIGTGIGGGAMVNGKMLHGATHPEMGHIYITQDKQQDPFQGVCAYHGNCFEGLASGPAMKSRWKVNSALDLDEDHPAWDLQAHYLAVGLNSYIMTLSPKRIIMGGGVMRQKHLLERVRKELMTCFSGFVKDPKIIGDLDSYIVHPALDENAGICGAIALAEQSYLAANSSTQETRHAN